MLFTHRQRRRRALTSGAWSQYNVTRTGEVWVGQCLVWLGGGRVDAMERYRVHSVNEIFSRPHTRFVARWVGDYGGELGWQIFSFYFELYRYGVHRRRRAQQY